MMDGTAQLVSDWFLTLLQTCVKTKEKGKSDSQFEISVVQAKIRAWHTGHCCNSICRIKPCLYALKSNKHKKGPYDDSPMTNRKQSFA
jgi:hypothetical protein